MTFFHGTSRTDWAPHSGACLVDDERVAREYARGGVVYRVEVARGLYVEDVEVTQARRAEMDYPGDKAAERRAFLAEGVDALEYDDETESGRQHRCFRLLSADALSACTVTIEEED